jgi:hypothetical protein
MPKMFASTSQQRFRMKVQQRFVVMAYSYATRGPDICANHGGIAELLR